MAEFFATLAEWGLELLEGAMHSTPQGLVGVGLIFFYFALILCAAFWRITKGEHLEHHHH
ncbi:MAG: hypothetical protein FWG17_02485 [Desulfovibrionaceae bacterium]|nr:hypothetical protein [Desulfovibrionaceae bacterium]